MANLELKEIALSYANDKQILKGLNFSVHDGELVSILGPSGCGKTTTLRIIAGLLEQSSGQVLVDGRDISSVPVHQRGFGMVFQSYALFPNLTVFENVAFGLKQQRVAKREISERVQRILTITGLDYLAERYPAELSGGQQQRVSLARALVVNPQLLLLDEPLSNLDAKLRVNMREEIRRLQQELKMTAIFVTHDQEECFAISDRVAVMNQGKIEQFDAPTVIYSHPKTAFVARFVGFENVLEVTKQIESQYYEVGATVLHVGQQCHEKPRFLAIRPTQINITNAAGENQITGQIISRTYLGDAYRYQIETAVGVIRVDEQGQRVRELNAVVSLHLTVDNLVPLAK